MKKIVFAFAALFFFSMTLLTSCLPEKKAFGVKPSGDSPRAASGYGNSGEKSDTRDIQGKDRQTASEDLRQIGKKALLIGIGNYPNLPGKSLKGPQNDVAIIKNEFLIPILGYKPDEIKVLTSPNIKDSADILPTKENIVRVMEDWFLQGDNVKERFFFFAGHGSQTDDLDGDENDGKDEVILPLEAGLEGQKLRRERLIIDDEIREWFEKLDGKKLIAVFDSCHSGTVCRSLGVPVTTSRFVGNTFDETKGRGNRQQRDTREANFADRIPKNHVYFYAAQSSELANEKLFDDTGLHQGFFTKAFVNSAKELLRKEAHQRSASDVSYLDLFVAVNDEMKNKKNYDQTPDIQPVYLEESPDKYKGTDSEALIKPFLSVSREMPAPLPGTETQLPDADQHKINVLLMQEGKKILNFPDLSGSVKYAFLDFEKKEKGYDLYINIRENFVELSNGNGDFLNRFDYSGKTQLVGEIEKRIQHAFLKDLLAKIKSPQAFPMSLSVEYEGKDYDKNDFYCGQKITYLLESRADVYVYVFSVDAAGSELNLYLPSGCQKNNRVSKGESIRILDEECSKDYELKISDKPGEELLKVIASPTPLTIRMPRETGEVISVMTFEEALRNIKDMTAQLKACNVWYEDTRKYMNHKLSDYQEIMGK
ncbi:MAG: hypothetical protein BWK80_43595 [Desulfobacteraceae bacterium IS3]|nr:MAG: hypothetical protein BWK80_43595 [Desulfobacteraceae bacterium IS3]